MTDDLKPVSEPAFNAPWQSLLLPVLLAAAFGAQSLVGVEAVVSYALSTQALRGGHWETLFTSLFLHGGWAHLFMNAGSALAFGPPVARALGEDFRGAALFYLFFLICGALAGLGFVAVHWEGSGLVVGASGAISGLWGAASRLLAGRGVMAPILSRPVVLQAVVFVVINVGIGLLGGFAQMSIAWEAHLAGYAAGLLLIGPAAHLANRSRLGELPSD